MAEYRIENYNQTPFIDLCLEKYRFSILISSLLASIGMGIWYVEQELFLQNGKNDIGDSRLTLLLFNMIVTLILCINIILSHLLWFRYLRAKGAMLTIDKISNYQYLLIAIELFANCITAYPFIVNTSFREFSYETKNKFDMNVNTIFIVLMFLLRTYHFVRPLLYYSPFMSNRAFRICNLYGFDCDIMFAIKGVFKEYNFGIIYSLYGFCILFFGGLYRFADHQCFLQGEWSQNFSWSNSWWWAIITMTTVGYGDFFAVSGLGRFITIICAFTGGLLESLAILWISIKLKFTRSEEFSFKLLISLKKKKKLMVRAVKMMISLFRLSKTQSRKYLNKYSNYARLFGRTAKHLRIQVLQSISKSEQNISSAK